MDKGAATDGGKTEIVAPVTHWFYRRSLLLVGLLAAMGLYFCYDGFIGYPKNNHHAWLYEAFQAGKNSEPFQPVDQFGTHQEDADGAFKAGAAGKSWAAHAATLHLPAEPPKSHSDEEIRTQKRIALALGTGAGLCLLWMLMHRGRAWRMAGGEIISPWHTRFAATSVTDIDRRNWDRGVALLIANDGDRFLKFRLDDYKYRDTGRIIDAIADLQPDVRIDPPLASADPGEPQPKT